MGIMMARLSPSDTLLARMDSESWKELMFPPELLVLPLPLLLPSVLLLSKLLHLFVRQLLLHNPTMTMLIHQLILTSTHSSTPMTLLTVTSTSTETEPTLPPKTTTTTTMPMLEILSTMFLPVLTVLELTHSSIPLMLLINKVSLLQLLLVKLQFSSLASNKDKELNKFSNLASSNQLNQPSKLSLLRPLHLQETSSLQVSSSLIGLGPDSTSTSLPSNLTKTEESC